MRFLSPEWLDRLASSMPPAGASAGLRGPNAVAGPVSVHQRVTGGPEGDIEYTVRLDGGTVSVEPGPGPADVSIVQDYDTAAAISQGRLSPAAAFAAGRLKLGGRVGMLVEHHAAFAALAAAGLGPATVTY